MYDAIILRYGEVGIKSRQKRAFFEKLYVSSIQEAFRRAGITNYKIQNLGKRFVLYLDAVMEAKDVLLSIPGIQSFSPAINISSTSKEDLLHFVKENAKEWVKDKMFRATVHRVGKHSFSSMELAGDIGEQLLPFAKGVSLKDFDCNINLEVRDDQAFLFYESFDGVGGMPARSSGPVLALFSGGIDSPVAVYEMLKRGCAVDFLFINLVAEESLGQVATVYNYLIDSFSYNYKPRFFCVDGKPLLKFIDDNVPDDLSQIALKIGFYKIAEKIMLKNKHQAIVTGEALAQKSTQTLFSLAVIASQSSVLVLRPLISRDKLEIISIANKIGTLAASEKVEEHCGLNKGKVFAVPHFSDLEKIPAMNIIIDEMFSSLVITKGQLPVLEDSSLQDVDWSKTVSVDVRLPSLVKRNPVFADKNIPYAKIIAGDLSLKKGITYLFLCEHGVLSEELAHHFTLKGFDAKSMKIKDFLELKKAG